MPADASPEGANVHAAPTCTRSAESAHRGILARLRPARRRPVALLIGVVAVILSGCNAFPGDKPGLLASGPLVPVVVETAAGPVEGRASPAGQVFLGIPYAAAPVGDLRRRAPRPVPVSTATRAALSTGSPCVQAIGPKAATGGGGGLVTGSEDCLFLNVYAPPAAQRPKAGWPVMVYIPGGAFTLGAGDNYDPSPLVASQQLVVVTLNYRLGAFGFLAHPALAAESPGGGSGNFALLDQQAALRWVRDNVAAMGGDPANVTLSGESAGAWSACKHLLSPASAGLFARAILQSGSCTERLSLARADEADAAGLAYAAQANCPDNTGAEAIACLRGLPARQVARLPSTRRGINGAGSWGPVWGDALIPLAPDRAFAEGRWNVVPTIVGSNRAEGRLFALATRDLVAYEERVRRDHGDAAAAVLAQYPVASYDGSAMLAYAAVMTDSRFACPADELRRALSPRAAVFGYEFADAEPPIAIPHLFTGGPMGPYHASELAFVFGSSWALANVNAFSPTQKELSARMMDAWGAFARTGMPGPTWKPFEGSNPRLQVWASQQSVPAGSFSNDHHCDFWRGFAR